MSARFAIATVLGATGLAFLLGLATAPDRRAPAHAVIDEAPRRAAAPPPTTAGAALQVAGRRALPTVRRFDPPPVPPGDPGIDELVNGPDEPSAEVIAARWEDVDRRLDELFGADVPAERRAAIRTALVGWLRDHGRAVRAYYRGHIDQAELTEHVHQNMLGFARGVEASLTRDQYRTFMDLEPEDDPFLVLVPPGTTIGGPMPQGPGEAP